MIILTGGAGFIGSALIAELNDRGEGDIVVVDNLDHERKGRNLRPLQFRERIGVEDFVNMLKSKGYDKEPIKGIIHLGACSSTFEMNWDYLQQNNVEYSMTIVKWCVENGVRCVYASSAATYGDGAHGFRDDHELLDRFEPLNPYGRSKLLVDIWARNEGFLHNVAGVRYFNVFGPNEWHKGEMSSVILKKFAAMKAEGQITLFKSHRNEFQNGEQKRDFIYVKDAVNMTLWLFDHPKANGVFNIGTGSARTWNDVARGMFNAIKRKENIRYIDMPINLRKQYQYITEADISKIRSAGWDQPLYSLESAVEEYIQLYLLPDRHLRE